MSAITDFINDLGKPIDYLINYEHNKKVAIGTGIPAIVALVALIAIAILFPPLSLPFLIGVGISGAALIALGTTSIVYGYRAGEGRKIMHQLSGRDFISDVENAWTSSKLYKALKKKGWI